MSQVVKKQKIEDHSFDYDYIVIGGGSGGMASAKEAAHLGAKVCLFDYVKPSTQGSKWGLGGTCVNVGCVPKKIMHYAGLLGAGLHDAETLGWKISGNHEHDWEKLRSTVQSYIKSLNFGYRNGLRSAQVNYINALASFSGPNTITYPDKNGQPITVSGARFLIAVGGRPHIPEDVPGAREHAITSDDIFSLKTSPGKTLVVGGSYIALECAGFLTELGYDTTVAVRSIPLRGFDRQCSEKVASLMADIGTNFRYGVTPVQIERVSATEIKVTFSDGSSDIYTTVLYATGRRADTSGLNLETVNVHLNKEGKIICRNEKTTGEHIYAVGDAVEGVPELTPAAIRAGELLARRLFGDSTEHINYNEIATTVFTPFEYGCVGLSEEVAEEQFGKDNIETFLFEFSTLELSAAHRHKVASRRADEFDENLPPPCLSKLVCLKTENLRVVGFHFVGPNAGEITQGFALALLMGATKSHFDRLVGIHPTDAESFTSLSVTRSSGESFVATGGCGGGKCG